MEEFLARARTAEGYADAFQVVAKILSTSTTAGKGGDGEWDENIPFRMGGGGKKRNYGSKNHLQSYGKISKEIKQIQRGGLKTERTIVETTYGDYEQTAPYQYERQPNTESDPKVTVEDVNINVEPVPILKDEFHKIDNVQLVINAKHNKTNDIKIIDGRFIEILKKAIHIFSKKGGSITNS